MYCDLAPDGHLVLFGELANGRRTGAEARTLKIDPSGKAATYSSLPPNWCGVRPVAPGEKGREGKEKKNRLVERAIQTLEASRLQEVNVLACSAV